MTGVEEPSTRPPPPGSPASRGDADHPPGDAAAPASTSATAPPPNPPAAGQSPPPPASPLSSSPSSSSPSAADSRPAGEGGGSETPSSSTAASSSGGGGSRKPKPASDAESSAKAGGSSNAEPTHPYHDFWRGERIRKVQPIIEERMRVTAYEGLQGVGGGVMRGPDTAWSYMYDSPPAALAAAAFVPLWSLGLRIVRQVASPLTEVMIREEIDHSFDAKELAESVAQAVPVFYEAVAEADSEALNRMCSPRAVEAIDRDRRRLREELELEVTRVEPSVRLSTLTGGNLWGPESIRAFDPAWAGSTVSAPHLSKSWLVVGVNLDVHMWVSFRRVQGGGGGGGDGSGGGDGKEVRLPVRRWGTWVLARGPLPKGPAESLECPWKLLAWY